MEDLQGKIIKSFVIDEDKKTLVLTTETGDTVKISPDVKMETTITRPVGCWDNITPFPILMSSLKTNHVVDIVLETFRMSLAIHTKRGSFVWTWLGTENKDECQ